MADPNTRQGKRTPVTLKIKFKSETLEQFIERYAVDVSQGGIFIRTKEPLGVGTQMKFEFQLKDASPLIAGEGTVVWTRENDPSRPAIAPGMGVRFDRLAEGSQQVLEKILAEKAKQAPQRTTEQTTKPPLFTDTPTRVAPTPIDDRRTHSDSEQTPLPKPMPFHSDAEDFDEKAFEEATKVRSLDDLVAETARADSANDAPLDELAARRSVRPDTPLAEPPLPLGDRSATVPDHDSAPILPSPPEPARAAERMPAPSKPPGLTPPADVSRTRLGVEPAKVAAKDRPDVTDRVSWAASRGEPPPTSTSAPSSAPIVIGILVVVAAALAAGWYFFVRPSMDDADKPAAGSAVASGSAGSAAVASGSGSAVASGSMAHGADVASGSAHAGSAQPEVTPAPPGPTVDTTLSTPTASATIEVVGTGSTGKSPLVAKLEKDKPYHVRISAPGYATKELDIKGGDKVAPVKLDPKKHVLIVTSDPEGAVIWLDGGNTGKLTPAEIELSASQAARPRLRVVLRKPRFDSADSWVDAKSYADEDARVTAKVDAHLVIARIDTRPPNSGTGSAGSGSASAGSAATGSAAAGSGSGSEGSGSATPTGGSAGSDGSAATGSTPAGSGSSAPAPSPGSGSGSAGSGSGDMGQ